jgi:hypothetical protein
MADSAAVTWLGVGIGLRRVLALAVEAHEGAVERGIEHVGDAQARLGLDAHAPVALEQLARRRVRNMAVARQFVREAAHVAGALHVVLAAQRIDADALAADVAGGHGEVGDGDHRRRALRMLGDAQAVVDRRIAARGVQARRGAQFGGRHAAGGLQRLGRILRARDELAPVGEGLGLAAFGDEGLVDQALGDDDMGHGREHGDVGAGPQLQVVGGAHMRRAHQVDGARIDHDQLRALAHAALEARGEHRVGVARVGADHHDDIGLLDRLEGLRAGRLAQGLLEAVAGRRMADAGAGIDVVVAEGGAHQLLHQVVLFVGAAAGDDGADRVGAVLGLDAAELARGVASASSHDTSRQGSLIFARIIGLVMRSGCVA